MTIIDAHIHLGNQPQKNYTPEQLKNDLEEAGAHGAVVFAFPEDMYRLTDTFESRIAANEFVLQSARKDSSLIPFYFVWNDYLIPVNLDEYAGIKWHRHHDEPRYDYADYGCEAILETIRALRLPVLIEEEFDETQAFIARNPEVDIIIPHMGRLNGGPERMDVFFDNPRVYFDTSMAPFEAIARICEHVGPQRIIFGSDVSGTRQPFFNFPKVELEKVSALQLGPDEMAMVLSENILKLTRKTQTHGA